MSVPHPDARPYPWLSSGSEPTNDGTERYLIWQPFAGMCNQFSCLECAVAVARLTGRTLVLPRWRPQYGWDWCGATGDYFDVAPLTQLCKCITLEHFAEVRAVAADGEGVALFRLELASNPTWSEQGFELYPKLRSLLDELEYFRLVDAESALRLGVAACQPDAPLAVAHEARHRLAKPLRGAREVSAFFAQPHAVLALDHAFNIVALPSVLDAGERALLLSALRPCGRLRAKLNAFAEERIARPCLAAHVRRTDHWRLARLMGDASFYPAIAAFSRQIHEQLTSRKLRSWLLATDCTDDEELAALHAAASARVDRDPLFDGEDGGQHATSHAAPPRCTHASHATRTPHVACHAHAITRHHTRAARHPPPPHRAAASRRCSSVPRCSARCSVASALLDMWLCAGSDFFLGTRGSMYTDYIARFRVADGKVVDHLFFELDAAQGTAPQDTARQPAGQPAADKPAAAADAGEGAAPSLAELLAARAAKAEAAEASKRAALTTAAAGGAARGDAMLGLMSMKLPPELRAKVLAFHPEATAMPPTICKTPKELFDGFITDELPVSCARQARCHAHASTAPLPRRTAHATHGARRTHATPHAASMRFHVRHATPRRSGLH
jgi:hypothetical protein